VAAPLATAYGQSPVIWTTIATGRTPREHGITGFVVPGPQGDVPVSAIREITRISGSHGARTKGIFIAHGPDIDPRADVAGIGIHDVAPTLLYALGLPVGEDMPGEAWTALFTDGFRRRHPLRTIETWGAPGEGEVTVSPEDQELIDELRALGYL